MTAPNHEVRHCGRDAESSGDCLFEIRARGVRIAEFRHDFRGEECRLRTSGERVDCDDPFEGALPWRVSEVGRAIIARHRGA